MPRETTIVGQYLAVDMGELHPTIGEPLRGHIEFRPTVPNVVEQTTKPISWGLTTYTAILDSAGYISTLNDNGTITRGITLMSSNDPALNVEFQYEVVYRLFTQNEIPVNIAPHYVTVRVGATLDLSDIMPTPAVGNIIYVPASQEALDSSVIRVLGRSAIIAAASQTALNARDAALIYSNTAAEHASWARLSRDQAQVAAQSAQGRIELIKPDPRGVIPEGRPVYRKAPIAGVQVPAGGTITSWGSIPDKPSAFPPEIGPGPTQAVAGNDPRLTNARAPLAHSHTADQLTYSIVDGITTSVKTQIDSKASSAALAQATQNISALSAEVEEIRANQGQGGEGGPIDLTGVALLDQVNVFTKVPKVPAIAAGSNDAGEVVNRGYLDSRLGQVGGGVPDATGTTKGAIVLSGLAAGAADGELEGTAAKPKVKGFDNKVNKNLLGEANGIATLDAAGDVPLDQLPSGIQRTDDKGQPNGYLGLDAAGKAPKTQLPGDTAYLIDGKLPDTLLPDWVMTGNTSEYAIGKNADGYYFYKPDVATMPTNLYLRAERLGSINGVASLGADGKVPASQLPSMGVPAGVVTSVNGRQGPEIVGLAEQSALNTVAATAAAAAPKSYVDAQNLNVGLRSSATITSSGGLIPDPISFYEYDIQAQASSLSIGNPVATVNGLTMQILLRDDNITRALTWGSLYHGTTAALPTTTPTGKLLILVFRYSTSRTRWELTNSRQEL